MKVDLGSFKEKQLVRITISINLHKLKPRPRLFRPLTGVSIDDLDQISQQCQIWWQPPVIKQKRLSARPGGFGDTSLMPSSWLPLLHQSVIFRFFVCRRLQLLVPILVEVSRSRKIQFWARARGADHWLHRATDSTAQERSKEIWLW